MVIDTTFIALLIGYSTSHSGSYLVWWLADQSESPFSSLWEQRRWWLLPFCLHFLIGFGNSYNNFWDLDWTLPLSYPEFLNFHLDLSCYKTLILSSAEQLFSSSSPLLFPRRGEGENPPGISQDRFSTIEIIQKKINEKLKMLFWPNIRTLPRAKFGVCRFSLLLKNLNKLLWSENREIVQLYNELHPKSSQ